MFYPELTEPALRPATSRRSIAAGRAAACRRRRIGDCKIGGKIGGLTRSRVQMRQPGRARNAVPLGVRGGREKKDERDMAPASEARMCVCWAGVPTAGAAALRSTEQARSAWRKEVRAAGRLRGRTREGTGGT